MRRNYNIGIMNRRLALGCLLLIASFGSLVAQTEGQFVIKTTVGSTVHYLSHVNNSLGDAETFSPGSLWTSDNSFAQDGANKNYYYYDGENYHFLGAPNFNAGGALSLSPSLPPVTYLNIPESQYYFYKWDGGLGRGIQYFNDCSENESACEECGHVWGDGQCWDVFWVAYYDNTWKLSAKIYDLDDVPQGGAKFYPVTVTNHANDTATIIGGLESLTGFEMEFNENHQVIPSISDYQYSVRPAYTTYVFDGGTHNYYGNSDQGETIPGAESSELNEADDAIYAWTLTGPGATYLSIDNPASASPTITYSTPNDTGHKEVTLTLTVTYTDGSKQTMSATILVKTPCQNPPIRDEHAVVTFVGVTVFWDPTAVSYKVSWQKQGDSDWNHAEVGNVTSYTITGLEYETTYYYKVQATSCDTQDPTAPHPTFTTLKEPGLMVTGAIFGGGRMANVQGKTEVIVVNCDSIGGIYGGNDIAGTVLGDDGATIMLGVNSGDATYGTYGTTDGAIRVSSVYGGGNGYYTYDGFEPGVEIGTTELTDRQFYSSVTEVGGSESYLTSGFIPTITKTAITVSNDYIKVDSIFGGARNAFVTLDDFSQNGSTITINGGTILAVYGGNNVGGSQKRGKHYIEVNHTTTNLVADIENTSTTGYGRGFGIRDLFGGGNKVTGSSTDIHIKGGQLDNVFAGGNSADVYKANVTVNCSLGDDAGDHLTFGNTYTNAIDPDNYSSGTIGENTLKADYSWDGNSGIYNVRTLYGGNNQAEMKRLPSITLTSGSVGTVYGGGNAGDMMGSDNGSINGNTIFYGTYVELDSDKFLTDFIYGGCRMSNVLNSTWVVLKKGHVGSVYGGCNISGDVGSTRVYDPYPSGETYPQNLEEQRVKGATYVQAGGESTNNVFVYKDLFAGSNGYYDCTTDGIHYTSDVYFDDPTGQYFGRTIPTHNETNVFVNTGATIKGNVYAGGNLAPVGFSDGTGFYRGFPELVGMATVIMTGGRVEKNVYGGGNMASIYGRNEVKVSGGTIVLGLYGGNDRAGQVAEKTNRKLPTGYGYTVASDEVTLLGTGVGTFVGVSGNAQIGTVYGGGNGAYDYDVIQYCGSEPIQSNTFVDIHLNGGALASTGGHIGTVYGGGNGVTIRGGATVFLNVADIPVDNNRNHVDTIFGGNNIGDLVVVPDILMIHGQVGTVYGGCNRGAMTADENIPSGTTTVNYLETVGDYENIGSYVRLLSQYKPNGTGTPVTVTAKVTEAVYGGCCMNGVTRNSLVLVEGGDFSAIPIFGGSDISGHVGGWSRVATVGGTVGNVYGGGNGNYDYEPGGNVYRPGSEHTPANLVATGITAAPTCAQSGADILGGQVGTADLLGAGTVSRVFGAGYGKDTRTTGNVLVNVGRADAASAAATPTIYGEIYGGSALGNVNTAESADNHYTTTVNFLNGTLKKATVNEVDYGGNLFGGGLGRMEGGGLSAVPAKVFGKVYVNISNDTQASENCFIDLRDANIFGCNNTNGSPQDDVRVDVWKTGYTTGDYASQTGTSYAIDQVFGGGNQADYAPQNGATDSQKKTLVYVHDCLNTIRRVFSGGNAAAATGVKANIEGGRFDYVFGGGNGEVSAANIGSGGTNLLVEAGIINHLFGGSNQTGSIAGPVNTTISGAHYVPTGESVMNPCDESITEFFGGSNQALLQNDVTTLIECGSGSFNEIYGGSKLADITGNVTLNIRGGKCTGEGSGVYGGSKGQVGDDPEDAADIDGNVTLNLEGGKITNAFGGSNINGNITGNITVNVIDLYEDCGLDLTNVYGGGNVTAYTPTNATITSPVVNVIHIAQTDGIKGNVFGGAKGSTATVTANPIVNIGYNAETMSSYVTGLTIPASPRAYVKGNVFGGGDAAPVAGNTEINVYSGEIVQKLVGGGNAADISRYAEGTGNTTINISGGLLCTDSNIDNVGIYGGCNTTGTVGGSVELNITGTAVIGKQEIVETSKKPVNVHGGGYGKDTEVAGNVVVNYGDITAEESLYPMLFGNLYGGSALGSVNSTRTDNTIVNVLNGSIVSFTEMVNVGQPDAITYYHSGNIFGGGLGRKEQGDDEAIAAVVNGTVHVNIGDATMPPSSGLRGKATLIGCNVYGCNNQYGSPQDNVYVDVYQTAHVNGTNTVDDDDYAILRVFGGGNEAHYAPLDGAESLEIRTHVYIHGCDNTIKYVYGGGNAADALGVESIIEGGHFDEVYGGGNGMHTPANIGIGSVGFIILGGHLRFLFEGSNKEGHIGGTPYVPILPQGYIDNCSSLMVDSYYFGDNEAEHIGDIVNTITCGQASQFNYKYVYAGSRWAVVYGDVKLTVQGGNIRYLFGGSKGYLDEHKPADIRRFPSPEVIESVNAIHPGYYSQKLKEYVNQHPEVVGTGGNIELVINGGTIGEVIGGCDELGTAEGTITVIVDQIDNVACPLFIGNVYGANNLSDCTSIYTDPDGVSTPKVNIIKGTIGGSASFQYDETNPVLAFDGNVFGGGNEGNTTSNPKVIVGDGTTGATATSVTIKGDVYGGGNLGDVTGSPKVIVVPDRHALTITQPEEGHGTISVAYTRGDAVASGALVGEDVDLRIIATPTEATADGGYLFNGWTVTTVDGASVAARVEDASATNTLFTMGTGNATLSASFVHVDTKALTLVSDPENAGTFMVNGVAHNAGSLYIPIGATVTVQALHVDGYIFKEWTVTSATLSSTTASITSFVMGNNAVTLTAVFEPVYTLTLVPNPNTPEAFSFKVNGANYTGPISYREGTRVTVQAITAPGYAFLRWEVSDTGSLVGNVNASTTSFTMGSANTILTAVFAETHTFNFSAGEHGTVTVTDIHGHPVQSGAAIGEGATLNISGVPEGDYIFDEWSLESGSGTITGGVSANPTTFIMGETDVVLKGKFKEPSEP